MTTSASSDAPAMPEPPAVRPLRLGVGHLLLWMLLTAVVAALNEAVMIRAEGATENLWWTAIRLIYSIGYGLALMGVVVIAGEVVRGRARQLAPGHVLILVGAAGAIADGGLYIAIQYGVSHFWKPDWEPQYVYWLVHQTVGYLGMGLVWTICLPLWRVPLSWRLAFVGFALLMLSQGAINLWLLLQWFGHVPFVFDGYFPLRWLAGGTLLCTLLVIAALVADWRCGRRYDWLHWAGVVLSLILACNQGLRFLQQNFFS